MADRFTGGFLAAVQFLTRVPVRTMRPPNLSAAVAWFPVVGALLGAAVGIVAAVLGEIVPMPVAATVAVLVGILLTGAFHEDGLADTADAIWGGSTRERRLEILKDPRHGTYGVAALAGSIVVRVVAVGSLGGGAAIAGLISAHTLGRGAAVVAMGWVPLARPDGLGADYTSAVSHSRAATGGVVAIAIAAIAAGWWVGPLALAAILPAVIVVALAVRALGGITGDVLGAVEQCVESAVLVAVTALAARDTVWWRV